MKQEVELLAPCGSWESLQAAVQAGCNAVYFGLEQLNMRARSSINFSVNDLHQITAFTRKHNVKSYVTLNTILYDHDLRLMRTIVEEAKLQGVDAIIASDLAVMSYCRKIKMPVHISTQANISNIDSLEFFAQFSDAVVLARELTLEQVKSIDKEIQRKKICGVSGELIKLELFAHGALCMAVSGKCYMSLHSHFASANRGACIQNCRRSYVVTDKEEGVEFEIDNEYIMSAKDLCTIDFLDKILDTGASILKIEGRGRSEDYVHTVTKCYREAIDAIQSENYSKELITGWKNNLSKVFNRGFWEGYYLGREMGEWSNQYGSQATHKKIYIGKGLKYYNKIGVGEFLAESHTLNAGDELLISGPVTGIVRCKAEEFHVDGKSKQDVKKGEVFSLLINKKIRPSDKIYKLIPN